MGVLFVGAALIVVAFGGVFFREFPFSKPFDLPEEKICWLSIISWSFITLQPQQALNLERRVPREFWVG